MLIIGLQVLLTCPPAMDRLFHTAPMPWHTWIPVLVPSALTYLLVELDEWHRRIAAAMRS